MFTDREINMDFSLNNLGYKHDASKGENEGIDILKFKAYLDNVTNQNYWKSRKSIFEAFSKRGGFEAPIINKAYEIKMENLKEIEEGKEKGVIVQEKAIAIWLCVLHNL